MAAVIAPRLQGPAPSLSLKTYGLVFSLCFIVAQPDGVVWDRDDLAISLPFSQRPKRLGFFSRHPSPQ